MVSAPAAPTPLMNNFPTTAFILGAGLGQRLRPLTENCPKPLLPIGDQPMVFRAMEKLRQAGVQRFIINTHHCPDVWKQTFPEGTWGTAKVDLVFEPTLLETGGGLANIAQFLTPEDTQLIIWNGDILSDCDIKNAYAYHTSNNAEATLIVREEGPNKNVRITQDGLITDMRDRLGKTDTAYQYTGICFVSRAFIQTTPATIESLVEHFLRRLQEAPQSVQGFLDSSKFWHDLGTVEEYQKVKAELEKPARGSLKIEEAAKRLGLILAAEGAAIKGGSGRQFYHTQDAQGHPSVLCNYDDSRPENLIYGDIAKVLHLNGLNVPAVISEDKDLGLLVLEDLGTVDLWSLCQSESFPWAQFASALEQVTHLHRVGTEAMNQAQITLNEPFNDKLYSWERQYFLDNVCVGKKPSRDVLNDMASLAKELSAQPQVVLHRDFQSQNILVKNDQAWLIDFQGARLGSMFYDYASLMFDPYLKRRDMDLWRIEIEDHTKEISGWKGSLDEFSHLLHIGATQRLLQACGAYAYLGKKKGRADFLAHLPQGLRNLTIAASLCGKRHLARFAEELSGSAVVIR